MDTHPEKEKWFSLTVRTNESKLIRYASKIVVLSLAREIVQETFLKAWSQKYPSLVGREGPWLFTVTRNLCFDARKKEGRNQFIEGDLDSAQESSLEKMEKQETENAVLRSVQNLSPHQQEVIRLKFQEGFSYQQISDVTGHSPSYVGVLIHEGMTILRRDLQGSGGQK